jgi:hypothetical protein
MKSKLLLFTICALPMMGAATVSGPVAGFVFDPAAGALRPMLGMPGAAYLGAPVAGGLSAASVSPDGATALAVRDGRLVVLSGLRSQIAETAVEGAIAADRFAWSADGSAAAIYSAAAMQAQILRGVGSAPVAGDPVELSGLPAAVASMAVSNSGKLRVGVAGGIYRVPAGAAPERIAAAGNPVAIAIAGTDAYFADQERKQAWQIASFEQDAAAMLFADGLETPVGLQVSPGRDRLFVADAGSNTVAVYDIASRAAAGAIALDLVPAMLDGFGSRSVWLLNPSADGKAPLFVLDSATAGAYFVPAGREE